MKAWKRFLFLCHRWVGIVLCAFFVLWFVSGIFMMYVEFPQLTRPERLAGEASLDFRSAALTPAQAIARLTRKDFDTSGTPSKNIALEVEQPDSAIDAPNAVRLVMLWNRPAYTVHVDGAQPRLVFADTGEMLRTVNAEQALRSVRNFSKQAQLDASKADYDGLVQTDQWTVSAALNDHRPLHRVALGDVAGTELYVSSRTGAVVRDSHSTERVLNYFAAVTHWLYPTFIRKYPDGWAWMVDILSGVGTIFAVSGLWIGVLRWRRNRPPGKSAVPYRGLMRWHYFTGIIFGVCLLTWVLSGLLSMNPAKLNPSRSPTEVQTEILTGTPRLDALAPPASVLPVGAVEAEVLFYDSQPFYSVSARDGIRFLVAAGASSVQQPTEERLLAAAPKLLPGQSIFRTSRLTEYDDYYYTRHPELGEKHLPILRVEFADEDCTWFHIDPLTGQVIERSTSTNRLFRWLYNGLHSWDIRWLWERRPLWDITVILFMGGGTLLSVIGVVVGVRRLRFDATMRARRSAAVG